MTRPLLWIAALAALLVPTTASAQDAPTMTETLDKLRKLTDRACECKDDACHTKVAAEVEAWTVEMDAAEVTDAELLTIDINDMADISMRLMTCSEPAGMALLAWSEKEPEPIADASPKPGEPKGITALRAVRDASCECKDADQACIDKASQMFVTWYGNHGSDVYEDAYMPVVEQLGFDFGRCSPVAMQAVLDALR